VKRLLAVAATLIVGLIALSSPSSASTAVPAMKGYGNYPEVASWSPATMNSTSWKTDFPAYGFGATQTQATVQSNANAGTFLNLYENGQLGNGVYSQTPFEVPTTSGHVYQWEQYQQNNHSWPVAWFDGTNWPLDGEIDASEWNHGANCMAWHFLNTHNGTNGAEAACYQFAGYPKMVTVGPNIVAGKWNTIDVAFFANSYNVYYNNQLYVTITYPAGYPSPHPNMTIDFANQDCANWDDSFNLCQDEPVDSKVADNYEVKGLTEFYHS
jgi:hypothetical protein